MSKHESKLPLFLAAIFLGYLVFWGFRYANSHRPPPVEQPVAQAPVPAAEPTPGAQTNMVASQTATDQPQTNLMTKHEPVNPVPDPYENPSDPGTGQAVNGGYMQNRKLAGITGAAGLKH